MVNHSWSFKFASQHHFTFEIREEYEQNSNSSRLLVRKTRHYDLEEALVKLIRMVREKNVSLTGPLVSEKATEFAAHMGLDDFQASHGWLTRFKKRENLNFQVEI